MLSVNLRTHLLILTDNREIPLTYKQYTSIKNEQKIGSYNDPITISDPDNGKIIFDGKISAIKEYREIQKINTEGLGYYCDYGHFHSINDDCNHAQKYSIPPNAFQEKIYKMFPRVNYNNQITQIMRKTILG